jgi:hypothetical protein
MFRKTSILGLLIVSCCLIGNVLANDSAKPATSLVPDNAILVVQVTQPKALIDRAFDERVVNLVKSLPPYEQAMAQAETQQVISLINFFENKYDAELPTLLGKLVGGGITLAVGPNESNLLIVDSEDGQMLQEVHDFFRTIARGEAKKLGDPDRVTSADYRGVTGWRFGPGEVHAIVGNRLLLSNKPDVLKAALDLHAEGDGKSIDKSASFQTAVKSLGEESQITVYADMNVLKQLPGFQQGLAQNENPLGRLLFAPLLAALKDATWLSAGIAIDEEHLNIGLIADRGSAEATPLDSFALPPGPDDGAMPNLVVPRQIAAMSLYRDMHKFYAAKDELFPERTSGLIFFENMMGIFFSGKDLTQEVLAEMLPDVRVVVAEQQYDEKTGTPALQLPGFAAIVRLRDPDKFSLVMKEAWQKAIGLVNFTRGQQALPGLIIDSATHSGTTYTTAFFSVADEENKEAVDVRFNFQPALAVTGTHLIMSSTDALACDLIDALQKEAQAGCEPVAGQHSLAMVKSAPLASILDDNRDAMIRQNMVEDGKSREQAEQEVTGILMVLKYFTGIEIEAGTGDDHARLNIQVGYKLQ